MAMFDGALTYFCLLQTARAAQAFLVLIACWALFMGLAIVWLGLKSKGTARALMLINGVLSLVFGFFVFYNPLKSTSVNFMVGFYTILLSLFLFYLTFRLIKAGKSQHTTQNDDLV
jgi:uncharacterized membrane protein HdeD (DUF308 family)